MVIQVDTQLGRLKGHLKRSVHRLAQCLGAYCCYAMPASPDRDADSIAAPCCRRSLLLETYTSTHPVFLNLMKYSCSRQTMMFYPKSKYFTLKKLFTFSSIQLNVDIPRSPLAISGQSEIRNTGTTLPESTSSVAEPSSTLLSAARQLPVAWTLACLLVR
jgi:hypothetical protein